MYVAGIGYEYPNDLSDAANQEAHVFGVSADVLDLIGVATGDLDRPVVGADLDRRPRAGPALLWLNLSCPTRTLGPS